ncbi:PQQ-binding-like beta-propeller repeat protein [Phaeodactylibacter xiamenensis]|uniref:outer membrane protein assembly factor BamB family protein n=1 Tax=Phaeodactylibacter xiamenensis TaxID=1524460 RepID=UPI003CCBC115
MKRHIFPLLFMFFLFTVSSCLNDKTVVTPQELPAPELTDTLDLSGWLTDSDQLFFYSLKLVNGRYLLIFESGASIGYSNIYRYDLENQQLINLDDLTWGDLRSSTISIKGDELILMRRAGAPLPQQEVAIIGIPELEIRSRIPIETTNYEHKLTGSNLYFKQYGSSATINLREVDLESGEVRTAYQMNREYEKDFDLKIEWDFFTSEDYGNAVVTLDRFPEGGIQLINFSLTESAEIWRNPLVEFGESDLKPYKVIAGDDRVYIFSKDKMSCRDLSTGALLWSEYTQAAQDEHNAWLQGDKVFIVSDEKIAAYSAVDGVQIWSKPKFQLGPVANLERYEDYLFVNQVPFSVEAGDALWTEPVLWDEQDPFSKIYNQPAVDLEAGKIYYLIDFKLYTVALPPFE